MLYIGVDLGTSSMKVLLVDSDGNVLRSVSEAYPLEFPKPGWSEQNPVDWWNALCCCIPQLMLGIDQEQVAGIAVAGQMHGLVALDERDAVLRPAILWNDGRTGLETDELNSRFGTARLLELTGNIAFAGFTAPKLLWMRKNEPDLYQKIQRIMLPKDYLVYRMTGVHCTDVSDASGMLLLDVKNRYWSEPLLNYCGLKQEQLGRLCESYEPVGTLRPEIARQLGLSPQTVVAAGAGDNAAAAVGTGTVGEACCNISLGTSGTVFISSNKFLLPPEGNLHSFAHADGTYHLMGCILSAASSYRWWTQDVLFATSDQSEQKAIREDALGRNHVFFLPYLMGERSPHNDPSARGAFLGMTMDTNRAEMTQAVLEGVAFAIRDSVEIARGLGLQILTSGLCGGGAKSPIWRKILANVLQMELHTPDQEEGAGYGAAVLAMVATGAYPTVKAASESFRRVGKPELPVPEMVARYQERYQEFRALYPALRPVYSMLSKQRSGL